MPARRTRTELAWSRMTRQHPAGLRRRGPGAPPGPPCGEPRSGRALPPGSAAEPPCARMLAMTATDTLGRPLRDLRISVTDRCNFRCVYCMPREVFGRDYEFLERAELLTFEEIERLARIFVADHGVSKIRLTGGEPLVRREVERLVAMLARIPGLGDLAMTTHGSALARKARALTDAGLRRITVSLDSLDNEVFAAINDVGFPVERVLAGIDAAAAATSCASSSKWTSATATAGGWTTWCRRRRSSR